MDDSSESDRTRSLGAAASLLVIAVVGVSTAALTYLTVRVACAVAPDVPFLNAGCDLDVGAVSLLIGGAAVVVAFVFWRIAVRAEGRRDGD